MSADALAWRAEELWQQIEPLLPGLSVEVVSRTDSTNTQLLQRFRGPQHDDAVVVPGRRASDSQPILLVAEHQTAGRGRLGRGWQSSRGASLTFSLAVPMAATHWSGLSLAVGVAVAESLEPAAREPGRPQIGLKWPNDLWLDERKLGGLLIETQSVGNQRVVVIGIGLNVLPMEVTAVSSGYACLREIDAETSAPSALHRLAMPLVQALRAFEREGFAPFAARFARRDVLRGRLVRSGGIEGTADGVTPDGALKVVTAEGNLALITSSEVSVRLSPFGPTTQPGLP